MCPPRALYTCALLLLIIFYVATWGNSAEVKVHNRAKRMLWFTHNRKFVLPRGTILDLAPKLQIPFIRQPPEGLNSDIQITWHFYLYFDKLGMTSDTHPWPLPFLYPFSGFFPYGRLPRPRPEQDNQNGDGNGGTRNNHQDNGPFKKNDRNGQAPGKDAPGKDAPGKDKSDPVIITAKPYKSKRVPRSAMSLPPPEQLPGGERATLIPQLEKMMTSMGYNGRACLLRTVCEIHEFPLHKTGFGLLGEVLSLVFSVSKSAYAESHLPEYLKAEEAGRAGECSSYFKDCTQSVFVWEEKNKYSKEMQNKVHVHKKNGNSSNSNNSMDGKSNLDVEVDRNGLNCNGLNCKDPENGYNYFFEEDD